LLKLHTNAHDRSPCNLGRTAHFPRVRGGQICVRNRSLGIFLRCSKDLKPSSALSSGDAMAKAVGVRTGSLASRPPPEARGFFCWEVGAASVAFGAISRSFSFASSTKPSRAVRGGTAPLSGRARGRSASALPTATPAGAARGRWPSAMPTRPSLATFFFAIVSPLAGGTLVERCGACAPTSFSCGTKTTRVVASTRVCARSLVRSCRRGARDRWAER